MIKTSQELRKLPYMYKLPGKSSLHVLSVLSVLDHDDHLVPDDYHNYDDLGDNDPKKATRQYAHC